MPFNSIFFFSFFASFFLVIVVSPSRYRLPIISVFSAVFYVLSGPINLLTILAVTIVCYFGATYSSGKKPFIAVLTIVSLLIFWRLTAFLDEWSREITFMRAMTPIGLSFYGLQAIGYLIDVKDGKILAEKNFLALFSFLSFFPQSVAGPIHRASNLLNQISAPIQTSRAEILSGAKKVLWGLVCKLLIADKIALFINPIFNKYAEVTGEVLLVASGLYSYQIYFDFLGYTLIAVGLAEIIGIKFQPNFDSPYRSRSLREFWHRWHITLSTWLRDYVYFRLGGKRQNYQTFLMAVTATFLVSGLWHGITINFFLWALCHAALYIAEDVVRRKRKRKLEDYSSTAMLGISFLRQLLVFLLITLTWVIFRSTDLDETTVILTKIFQPDKYRPAELLLLPQSVYFPFTIIFLAILLFRPERFFLGTPPSYHGLNFNVISEVFITSVTFLLLFLYGDLGIQEFLYFNF